MGQGEQGLLAGVQAALPAALLLAMAADQVGQVVEGTGGQGDRGRVGQHEGLPGRASDLRRLLSYREPAYVSNRPSTNRLTSIFKMAMAQWYRGLRKAMDHNAISLRQDGSTHGPQLRLLHAHCQRRTTGKRQTSTLHTSDPLGLA